MVLCFLHHNLHQCLCPSTNSTPAGCSASDDDLAALAAKNLQLEKDLVTLRKDQEKSVEECEPAHQKIKSHENLSTEKTKNIKDLKNEVSKKNGFISTLNLEIYQLNQEMRGLGL